MTDCRGPLEPTNCVAKVKPTGESVALGPEVAPAPLSGTDCGLPGALSVMVIAAVRDPSWLGLKVTLMAQCPPGETLEPQLFVSVKSLGLVPVIAGLLMVSGRPPMFVSVTVWTALLYPTS